MKTDEWSPWLEKSATIAYQSAGSVLHPDELSKGMAEPGEYISEHSGIDPASLSHLNPTEAGAEMARGIRRNTSEMNAAFDSPPLKFHMDIERFNAGR